MSSAREYPDHPILGVGAIIIDGDRVLLVRRAKEPLKGQWSIPGGAVEVGEALLEALAREIREETGLEVRPRRVLEVFDRILRDPDGRVRYHYVLVDYLCERAGGEARAASDVDAAEWAEHARLGEFKLHPETLRVIEKAFSA